jgi:hypothetical protein
MVGLSKLGQLWQVNGRIMQAWPAVAVFQTNKKFLNVEFQ